MKRRLLYFLSFLVIVFLNVMIIGYGEEVFGSQSVKETKETIKMVPLNNVLKIEAEKEILHYEKESFWDDKSFSDILSSENEFKSEEIKLFKEKLEGHNLQVINPEIQIDNSKRSTVLICDLKGSMYSTDSYDFHWLLGDLPFDLYQFNQLKKELIYKGKFNGIPETIKLIFHFNLAHCHEHIWPG